MRSIAEMTEAEFRDHLRANGDDVGADIMQTSIDRAAAINHAAAAS